MRAWWIGIAMAGCVAMAPAASRACSWDVGVHFVLPEGDEHPANAAVVLVGSLLELGDLTATVDGMAVGLVVDDELSAVQVFAPGWQVLALRLDPPPQVGQSVTIVGSPCTCGALEVTYGATAPDLSIDDPTPMFEFDVAKFSDSTGNSCGGWGSVLRVRGELEPTAFTDEVFVLSEVVARHDGAGLIARERRRLVDASFGADILFPTDAVGDDFPLEGWCVDVRMLDAAGNSTTVATSCEACNQYDGPPHDRIDEIPFEPAPGGPCDPGGSSSGGSADGGSSTGGVASPGETSTTASAADTTDGDDSTADTSAAADGVADRGCSCTADRVASSLGWLAIVVVARRRRRST